MCLYQPICFYQGLVETPTAAPEHIRQSSSLCSSEGQTTTITEKQKTPHQTLPDTIQVINKVNAGHIQNIHYFIYLTVLKKFLSPPHVLY